MTYIEDYRFIPSHLVQGENKACFLSVVIPTYRNMSGVLRAVESVLCQVTKLDFNVIIVDNEASSNPNDTEIMLRRFADNKKVVYYKNEENLGMYGNWNRCFEQSKSEYVLMLHADDYLLPHSLEEVWHLLKKYPHICAFYANRYSATYSVEPTFFETIPGWKTKLKRRLCKVIHHVKPEDYLFGLCLTAPTGFVCRSDVFMASGGFNTRSQRYPGDTEFALSLARKGKIWFYDVPLVVKQEGNGNDGSDKTITSALIPPHQTIYKAAFINSRIPFKSFLLSMRLISIMESFGLEKKDVSLSFEDKYFSKRYKIYYRLYRLIYYYFGFVWR